MMEGNNVFEDYDLWEQRKKLEEHDEKRRSERKYLFSYTEKEGFKGNYKSLITSGMDYLEETYRDKFSEWVFIYRLARFLKYPENYIEIKKEHPTIIQIGEMFGIKKRRVQYILKELEYMEVIKIKKSGRNNVIYVNPFFLRAGEKINKSTCEMFRDTICYLASLKQVQ